MHVPRLDGRMQLPQPRSNLGVHLALAGHLLGERVAVGAKGLADLKTERARRTDIKGKISRARRERSRYKGSRAGEHYNGRMRVSREAYARAGRRKRQGGEGGREVAPLTFIILVLDLSPAKKTTKALFSSSSPLEGSFRRPTEAL